MEDFRRSMLVTFLCILMCCHGVFSEDTLFGFDQISNGFKNQGTHLLQRDLYPMSLPLYRALLSGRVPVSTLRAMAIRYVENRYGSNLATPFLRVSNARPYHLTQTLYNLHVLFEEMAKVIGSGIEETIDKRVYTFVSEHSCNCSFFYVDEEGIPTGLAVDVLEAVCKEAGKICKLQVLGLIHCITDVKGQPLRAAPGLLARQFDACIGFAYNSGLKHIVSVSDSFVQYHGESQFFVRTGNPGKFDPSDVTGRKVVFFRTWDSNYRCLLEHGVNGVNTEFLDNAVYLDRADDLLFYMDKYKVDAVFGLEMPLENGEWALIGGTPDGLEPIGDVMHCAEGVGVVSRKDSPVTQWFNEALRTLKKNGKFAAICRDAKTKHRKMDVIECEY
ncbi:uncharacterized protein [Ptychodera flava]|uniref:uncharacterized protein n=1 Tax=Ptychodera flava TaxID=63121 RepID=UPI003969C495